MSDRLKKALDIKKSDVTSSYQWPSIKTIRDIADAYNSIYEAKKKVDQDQDGDNDFADVQIARMIASGMTRKEAIAAVKNKEYNEEYELDEATRMRKELGKEGEIKVRKELARRSNAAAAQRSGSVDRTIAAAERRIEDPYIKFKPHESDKDRKKRKEEQSKTLTRLASSRRGSVRDKPRVQLRGYPAKVEGSDRELQRAKASAMAAGTLTPREMEQLGIGRGVVTSSFEMWVDGLLNEGYDLSDYTWNEVYEIYEDAIMEAEQEYEIYNIVLEYLISNHYTETEDGANTIIENMSDVWIDEIINEEIVERGEGYKGGPKFSWMMKPSKPKPPSGKKGDRSGYGPDEKFKTPEDKIKKPGTDVPPPKKGGYRRISRTVPIIGPHADKPNSRVTTVTGGDPGASPSKKIAKDDRKPKPIKRGKFTVVPIEPPSK
jgi:hypothetical protein